MNSWPAGKEEDNFPMDFIDLRKFKKGAFTGIEKEDYEKGFVVLLIEAVPK
jgi:hypothetical protein